MSEIKVGLIKKDQSAIGAKLTHYGDFKSAKMMLDKDANEYVWKVAFKGNSFDLYDLAKKHDGILEHTVFSFSIENISRLAVEYLEHHRLASYLEVSFRKQRQLTFYHDKSITMKENQKCIDREEDIAKQYLALIMKKTLPENARYMIPLSVLTSVQLTVNARAGIRICQDLINADLKEVRDLGNKILRHIQNHFGWKKLLYMNETKAWNPFVKFALTHKETRFEIFEPPFRIFEGLVERRKELSTISIEGYLSDSAISQLRRHRIGSLFIERLEEADERMLPDGSIVDFKYENEYSAPMGVMRRFKMFLNLRSYENILDQRLNKSAQKEIRKFFEKIVSMYEGS